MKKSNLFNRSIKICLTLFCGLSISINAQTGEAFSFDGVDDFIETNTNITELGQADFTIEAWIKTTNSGQGIVVCSNTNTTWQAGEKAFYIHPGGVPRFVGWGNNYIQGNITVNDGNWHHLAVVWDYSGSGTSGIGQIFVDGINRTATYNYAANYNNLGTFKIGRANYWTLEAPNHFNGQIDEVRIWNVARTQCEIQTYMLAEITSTATGLMANYHFNQGVASGSNTTITTLTDAAAGNNGTLTNCALTGTFSNWVAPGGVVTGNTITTAPTATISVSGNGNPILNSATTTSTLNSTHFNSAGTKTFVVTNTGTGTLNIGVPYITGINASEYFIVAFPASFLLAANASASFIISFVPTTTGLKNATVNIASNDCATPVFNYAIQGSVSATPASALSFDGVNDYITSPALSFSATGKVTIEAWIKPVTITTNSFYTICRQDNPTTWLLAFQNNGTVLSFGLSTSSGYSELDVTINPSYYTNGNWHHVAGVYDGSNKLLYVDGILIGSSATTGSIPSPGITQRIGSSILGEYYRGQIDEVRFWDVARTQCEINTFKSAEIPSTAPGLLANYHFNQGIAIVTNTTVTTLVDAAGANTGSLVNFVLTNTVSNWVTPGAVANDYTTTPAPLTVSVFASNSVICSGASVILNGSGANSYSWTGGVTNGIAFSPSVTNSYTVYGTNTLTSCSNTAVSTITVNTTPSITVNSGSICSGQTFTISPSGANSYTYQGGNAVITPTSTSGYTVVGSSTAGCISAFAICNVTVNATPTISVNSGSICSGNSFTINPSGANSYTYQGGSAFVSPTSTSGYTVVGSSTAGCISTFTTSNVTVNTTPTISVNSGSICSGQAFTIVPSGANSYTYQGGSAVISPASTSGYTVVGSSTAGCISAFATSNVTVNMTPTISVNSGSICSGNSFTIIPSGANTYTYSGGSAIITPSVNSSYTVSGTSIEGCSDLSGVISTVTVNTTPTITVPDGIICAGGSFVIDPSGADFYSVSGSSFTVSPSTTTSYSVTGTSSLGCSAGNTAVATVSVQASLTVSISGNNSVCNGQLLNLSANGAMTYTWNNGLATQNIILTPTANTTYSVLGASGSCSSTAFISVTVNPLPVVSAFISDPVICYGATTALNASGTDTYTWSGGATNGVPFTPTTSGSYSVTGTNTLTGCTSTNVVVQTVTVNTLPLVSATGYTNIICLGESINYTAVDTSLKYNWSTGSTNTTTSYTPLVTGDHTLTLYGADENNCSNTFAFVQSVSECTSLKELKSSEAIFKIYPNPNNGVFTITSDTDMHILLVNGLGQIVKTISLNPGNNYKILISELDNGIYFLLDENNNSFVKQKIIVTK